MSRREILNLDIRGVYAVELFQNCASSFKKPFQDANALNILIFLVVMCAGGQNEVTRAAAEHIEQLMAAPKARLVIRCEMIWKQNKQHARLWILSG